MPTGSPKSRMIKAITDPAALMTKTCPIRLTSSLASGFAPSDSHTYVKLARNRTVHDLQPRWIWKSFSCANFTTKGTSFSEYSGEDGGVSIGSIVSWNACCDFSAIGKNLRKIRNKCSSQVCAHLATRSVIYKHHE